MFLANATDLMFAQIIVQRKYLKKLTHSLLITDVVSVTYQSLLIGAFLLEHLNSVKGRSCELCLQLFHIKRKKIMRYPRVCFKQTTWTHVINPNKTHGKVGTTSSYVWNFPQDKYHIEQGVECSCSWSLHDVPNEQQGWGPFTILERESAAMLTITGYCKHQ